ncbi:MAG: tetratricopeptide repeat protein [Hyphomicrobiales bacterium]|nr:tetratricopeptide repeat protein [Hyphomicrobiales bacterium]
MRARALLGVALAALLVFAAPRAARAEKLAADVETSQPKGFGRLVLSFRNRNLIPQYSLKQSNGVVVLEFEDEVEANLDQVATQLGAYVTVARRDPDGHAMRLALARQVKVNAQEAGEKLFLDFLPAKWAGAPPPLPPEVIEALAKRAEAAMRAAREAEMAKVGTRIPPKLDFKIGRLPTFTRLSFGWNVPFDTRMTREGDRVSLTFNRPGKIDLSQIDVQPVPGLVDVFSEPGEETLKIVLTVAPNADVRAFREKQSYVLDLMTDAAPANPGEALARSVVGAPSEARGRLITPGRPDEGAPVALPPMKAAEAAPAHAPMVAKAGEAEAGHAPPQAAPSAAATPAVTPAVDHGEAAPPPAKAAPALAGEGRVEVQERALPTTDAPPAPAAAVKPQPVEVASPDAPTGERPPAFAPRHGPVEATTIKAEAKRIGEAVRIAFPFPARVAAAAFMRGETLWVVLDTAKDIDVSEIAPNLGPAARSVDQIRAKSWTALRIDLKDPLLTTLSPDGEAWVLSIGEMVLEPTKPLALRRFVRGDGNRSLKIELPDGGAVREFVDPTIGDRLVVVTAMAPSRGLLKPQSFVDLDTFASAHGVALAPHGDDVQVLYQNGEVIIGREQGLSLSNGAVEERSTTVPRLQPMLHHIPIDPAAFERRDAGVFQEKSRQLLGAVMAGGDPPKRQARIDLAEFYVGRRFAPEALAQLRLLAEEEPAISRDSGFIVLWGAAQTLAGRAKEAVEALSRPEVATSPDASLWRAIAADDLAKWDEARESALRATSVLGAYPKAVQALFNISAAEAAIELNDLGMAQARLAEVEPETLDGDLAGRYEIAEARLADLAGRPEDAAARFERAIATGDRRVQALAEYQMVRSGVRDGKIDKETAIERMRSLSFGWRGDETELRTLRFLAGLLADTGRYREAFQAMRSALQVAPDSPTTRLLQDEMGKRFLALYLDDADKSLKPIDALTLYYDFRELVPIDRRGDELVRKLADRLVGVDLLPQAAELLSYQIDNRLKGAARAQIAADLAVVHLLDRKPEKAIAVLNKTRQSQLPMSLERQRRLVEARALSDAGRSNTALELLSSMTGSDVTRLKADVLWKGKRWREAGERLEALLGNRWQDALPLDDQERQDVLRVAIAYALANDQLSLDRLRGKFRTKMAASPQAHTFDVVTQPIQSQGGEFRDVARQIASLDTMRQFLQEYRAQYLDPKARTVAPEPAAPAAEPPKPAEAGKPEAKAEPAGGKPEEKKVAQAEPAKTEEPKPATGH